ncbi:YfhO family protein [Zhouia sp. PK063]|uniref:YfhO family protein n=1 Tax=Zhouia sp. PK063 TaxID=3373602 RepID=UPI00378AF39F
MNISFKKILPHIAIIVLFVVTALAYFSPVLRGKQIYQSDIAQYTGMAKERNDYKAKTGVESYWTDSAFGGMPTFQLGANYPHDYIKKLDHAIRFLPRPADYLFLYFIGFYILLLVLKVDYKFAALGALAFGFSTYLIIIIGVGHNAKAHAIGYFPLILAGILLIFKRKYVLGFILASLAFALEMVANHIQMTYYLGLLCLVVGIVYFIDALKNKTLPSFFKSVGLIVLALILGIATDATNLMATKQYADWSTRGKTELTKNPDGSPKENKAGLNKDYITTYSYGLAESLDLFVPGLMGGSGGENVGTDSNIYKFLIQRGVPQDQAKSFSQGVPTYWGKQPIVAGPAYVGAIVIFLFVLGLFLIKGKLKWWLVAGTLLSLLLSWGKNFGLLTDVMINYFPLYNKFRAVSSIQVILELCVPILATIGVVKFFSKETTQEEKLKALKYTAAICGGLLAVLFILKNSLFNFVGVNDGYYRQSYGADFMNAVIKDRKAMYNADILRSFILIAFTAAVLWFALKEKLKLNMAVVALAVLVIFDLVGVAKRYVNDDDFVSAREINKPFQATAADQQIDQDTTHFRVFNPSEGVNGARTSFFHNSIGGYHAAKPGRFEELYEYQIAKNNVAALNMLNVKYVIRQNDKGQTYAAKNPYAYGNAWFVKNLVPTKTADQELGLLDSLDLKTQADFNSEKFGEKSTSFQLDSTATIALKKYTPNQVTYTSSNANDGVGVFSEIYFPHGWKATIDGKETDIFRVNYVLRALQIPSGKHTIVFTFDPQVVKTGATITLASSIILLLVIVGGIFYGFKNRQEA